MGEADRIISPTHNTCMKYNIIIMIILFHDWEYYNIPYSLIFSRIKYFAVWLNSAQKQIFTDKIFVVERELC